MPNGFHRPAPQGIPPFLAHVILWGGVLLLVWNETSAALREHSLDTGAQTVVSVRADRVDPANEGRLIHLRGELRAETPALDPVFGAAAGAQAFLRRKVEMRQWRPNPDRGPGGGRNGFTLVWSAEEIDSRAEGAPEDMHNPPMPLRTEAFVARGLSLGAFAVDEVALSRIKPDPPPPATRAAASALASALPGHEGFVDGRWIVLSREAPTEGRSRSAREGRWPIGALRIQFETVPLGEYSITARQEGNRLRPQIGASGDGLLLMQRGSHAASESIQTAKSGGTFVHWAVRLLGMCIVLAGIHFLVRARDNIRRYGPDYYDTDD